MSDCTNSTVNDKNHIVKIGHHMIWWKSHQSYNDTLLILYYKKSYCEIWTFLNNHDLSKSNSSMTLFQIYMMTHSHNCCGHKKTDMTFTNMRYVQWSNHSLIEEKKWNRSIAAFILSWSVNFLINFIYYWQFCSCNSIGLFMNSL